MDLNAVFSIFLTIIIEFLFELYILYGLIFKNLKKRKDFILRLIIGFIVVLVVSFVLSIFYYYFSSTILVRIPLYILLFAVSLIHVLSCVEESFWTISFGCLMAYASQNLIYKLSLFVFCILIKFNLIEWWGESWSLWYRVYYYSFFIICIVGLNHIFIKNIAPQFSKKELNIQLLIM